MHNFLTMDHLTSQNNVKINEREKQQQTCIALYILLSSLVCFLMKFLVSII